MPERRHHAATLKVKTLQSARQPAMQRLLHKWGFPKIRVPQNGWFIMENLIKMDDLGENPLFSETSKCSRISPPPTVRLSDRCRRDAGCLQHRPAAAPVSWHCQQMELKIPAPEKCGRAWSPKLKAAWSSAPHEVKMMYHMIWIDLVASCLESDGNPMEISWKIFHCCDSLFLCGMTSKHRSSLCGSHTETASKMLQGVYLVPKQHVIELSTCLKSSKWQWCHTSPFRAPFLPLPVRTGLK